MNLFRWKYQFAAVGGRGHAATQAQHECQHFHVGQVVKPAADCQIDHARPFGLTIGAMNLLPRRNFFASVRNLVAAGGVLGQFRPAQAAAIERGEDYYDKLGVTKIINAAGTYTALTASMQDELHTLVESLDAGSNGGASRPEEEGVQPHHGAVNRSIQAT